MREPGAGEQAAARRRRRILTIFGVLFVLGFFAGFGTSMVEDRADGSIPVAWAVGVVAASVLAILYGSWRYWRSTDELDRRDNLMAAAIGLNVYLLLYPAWYVLWKAAVVGEPDGPLIYAITLVATMLAYGWKKLRP